MSAITYPTRTERLHLHRDVTTCRKAPAPTPYQRGFEDYTYSRRYANPYRIGSQRWHDYCAGNEDARRAEREARP